MRQRRAALFVLTGVAMLGSAPALAFAEDASTLPLWVREPGWPAFWACGGCAIVLALTIGGVLVGLQRRAAKRADAQDAPPLEA